MNLERTRGCDDERMVRLSTLTRRPVGNDSVGAADWALAGLLVLLSLFAPRTGQATPESSAAWALTLAIVFAVGQGLPVALRRRYPLPVAMCVLTCYAGQALLEGVVPPFAPWVVIWSLAATGSARAGSARRAATVAAVTCALVVVAELTRPGMGASALLVLVTVVVTLAAALLRSERDRVDALQRKGATEERLRIARDLHDLVGHGLSVVAIQSSTARMALDAGDTGTARSAMSAVEAGSRTALSELRQMLGVLTGSPSGAPAPGLGDVPALVENVRVGGVPVELDLTGSLDGVPRAVQLGAYRVVQEALTNAVKHAPGAAVAVRVAAGPTMLSVDVESSGGEPAFQDSQGGGYGLDGLRARVAGLSGELRSERTAEGWLLQALLPLQGDELARTPEEGT